MRYLQHCSVFICSVLFLGTNSAKAHSIGRSRVGIVLYLFSSPAPTDSPGPLGIKTNQKREDCSSRKPGTFHPLARYG